MYSVYLLQFLVHHSPFGHFLLGWQVSLVPKLDQQALQESTPAPSHFLTFAFSPKGLLASAYPILASQLSAPSEVAGVNSPCAGCHMFCDEASQSEPCEVPH